MLFPVLIGYGSVRLWFFSSSVTGLPNTSFEAVNEFTDRMKDTLEEAKSALAKAKDDMAQYYNCHRSPTPSFSPGDMVYLDSEDIQTTR